MPANGETAIVPGKTNVIADVSLSLLKRSAFPALGSGPYDAKRPKTMHGAMVISDDVSTYLMLGSGPYDAKRPKTMHGAMVISDDVSRIWM